ncbi:MAG: hypothetical protein U0175_19785 [Caldilineaceae bacterium]
MNQSEEVVRFLERIQGRALIGGGVAILLAIVGFFLNRAQFFQSYLFAYFFWLGVSLGCLALLLVYHITGGHWGFVIRRILEAAALVSLLMIVLIVPLFFGMSDLYSWVKPDVVAADPLLQHKQPYLNLPFFVGRNVIYFVVWCGATLLLARWSWQQDGSAERAFDLAERMRHFSAPGLALYGLAMTFAAIDWLMSLEPHWFSTIFGAMIASAQVVTGLAVATILLCLLIPRDPQFGEIADRYIDDFGKLLLSLSLFWVYMTFIQYLIIWAGNLPEEVVWYLRRLRQGWQWVAVLVLLFHFVLPFAALLAGQVRKQRPWLTIVAASLVGADLVYFYWVVTPVFHPAFHLHWLDIVIPCAIGGLWLAAFSWQLRRRPLLPNHDPVWEGSEAQVPVLETMR